MMNRFVIAITAAFATLAEAAISEAVAHGHLNVASESSRKSSKDYYVTTAINLPVGAAADNIVFARNGIYFGGIGGASTGICQTAAATETIEGVVSQNCAKLWSQSVRDTITSTLVQTSIRAQTGSSTATAQTACVNPSGCAPKTCGSTDIPCPFENVVPKDSSGVADNSFGSRPIYFSTVSLTDAEYSYLVGQATTPPATNAGMTADQQGTSATANEGGWLTETGGANNGGGWKNGVRTATTALTDAAGGLPDTNWLWNNNVWTNTRITTLTQLHPFPCADYTFNLEVAFGTSPSSNQKNLMAQGIQAALVYGGTATDAGGTAAVATQHLQTGTTLADAITSKKTLYPILIAKQLGAIGMPAIVVNFTETSGKVVYSASYMACSLSEYESIRYANWYMSARGAQDYFAPFMKQATQPSLGDTTAGTDGTVYSDTLTITAQSTSGTNPTSAATRSAYLLPDANAANCHDFYVYFNPLTPLNTYTSTILDSMPAGIYNWLSTAIQNAGHLSEYLQTALVNSSGVIGGDCGTDKSACIHRGADTLTNPAVDTATEVAPGFNFTLCARNTKATDTASPNNNQQGAILTLLKALNNGNNVDSLAALSPGGSAATPFKGQLTKLKTALDTAATAVEGGWGTKFADSDTNILNLFATKSTSSVATGATEVVTTRKISISGISSAQMIAFSSAAQIQATTGTVSVSFSNGEKLVSTAGGCYTTAPSTGFLFDGTTVAIPAGSAFMRFQNNADTIFFVGTGTTILTFEECMRFMSPNARSRGASDLSATTYSINTANISATNNQLAMTNGAIDGDQGSGSCFSGDTVVATEHGSVSMSRLSVGDLVQTVGGLQPVLSFVHQGVDSPMKFVQISHDQGIVEMSDNHMLHMVDGRDVAARDIRVGDRLVGADGTSSLVREIAMVEKSSWMAPLTESGTVIAGGVAASAYVQENGTSHWVAHFGFAPIRFLASVFSFMERAADFPKALVKPLVMS